MITRAQEFPDSIKVSIDDVNLTPLHESKLHELFEKVKIPIIKENKQKILGLAPALAWNNYDKTQIGLLVHLKKHNKYEVLAMPMYGTGSKNLTGIFNSSIYFHPKRKKAEFVNLGLSAKRFSYLLFPEDLTYNKIRTVLNSQHKFKFKGEMIFGFTHYSIWQEYILNGRKTTYFYANRAVVKHNLYWKKISSKTTSNFLQSNTFGTWEIQNNFQYRYNRENKFYLRTYFGTFLYNTKPSNNIQAPLPVLQLSGAANNGIYWLQKDFLFDDLYLDRNSQDEFFRRQVANSEGGFLSLTSIGNVNSFLFAANLKTDIMLPRKMKWWVNAQPFLNFALGANKNASTEIYAEGGASLLFFNEVLGFHIPFATTNNIKSNQATAYSIDQSEWTKRITFSINFQKIIRKRNPGINH